MSVIEFGRSNKPPEPKEPEQLIWICAHCGCKTFKLYSDGMTECASCEHQGEDPADGEWRRRLAPLPTTPPPAEDPKALSLAITSMESSAAALQRTLRKADADRTALVILMHNDGGVSTWGEVVGPEQEAWFDRRIAEARQMLIPRKA